MWLTLKNSLDRDPAGAALAAYVREIAEPTTEQVAEIIADSDATLDRMAPVVQCSTEPTRHAPHIWRGAGQHVDNPIRYSCPGYDGCTKCTDPIPHTHTGYHGAPVHDAPTDALSVATNAIVQAPARRRVFATELGQQLRRERDVTAIVQAPSAQATLDDARQYHKFDIVWFRDHTGNARLAVVTTVAFGTPSVYVRVNATGVTVCTSARSLSPYVGK